MGARGAGPGADRSWLDRGRPLLRPGTYRLSADPSGLTYVPARGPSHTTRLDDIQVLLPTDRGLAVITADTAYTVHLAKRNAPWLEQRIEAHWWACCS